MAWGIPGNVGEIYRKQQSDELKDQLLQQTLAQRIKEFDQEQQLKREEMQAQAEDRKARLDESAASRRMDSNRLGLQEMQMTRQQMDDEEKRQQREGALRAAKNIEGLIPFRQTPEGQANIAAQALQVSPERAVAELLKPPEESNVTTTGAHGEPIIKRVTDAQLREGVPGYRAPQQGGGAAINLTSGGLDAAAIQYAMSGQLPALGMGAAAAAARATVINRAAEMFPGLNPSANAADTMANRGSLTNITKQLDSITAYESTAGKNLDVFLKVAEKIPDTGSPYLNQPLRNINAQLLGSPDMAAFRAARDVVMPEFARIITNPNLSGVLSDSARNEIASITPENATLAQIKRVATVLQQDAKNRKQGLIDQRTAIQGRMQSPGEGGGGTSGAGAPMQKPIPSIPGGIAESTDGGKTWKRVK